MPCGSSLYTYKPVLQVGSKGYDVRDRFCFFIPLAIRSVWAMSRHSVNILFINKVIKAKCFKQNEIKDF